MIQPVNNYCLIEVLDEYSGLAHINSDGQKGVVRDVNVLSVHLTASTGFRITDDETSYEKLAGIVGSWVGKTVRYALYADADSSRFREDGKEYVLIPWYRVLGVERDVAPTTDSKK